MSETIVSAHRRIAGRRERGVGPDRAEVAAFRHFQDALAQLTTEVDQREFALFENAAVISTEKRALCRRRVLRRTVHGGAPVPGSLKAD
jgi:hypothetical protein